MGGFGSLDGADGDGVGASPGGEEAEAPEVPPSWCRRIEISQEEFAQRSLGGSKELHYARCKSEIFAEYQRDDGCVSRLTLFADDACTEPIEIREKMMHRQDCLVERSWSKATGGTHE